MHALQTETVHQPVVSVSAAVLFNGDRVLLCKRKGGGSCAHLWEFPGGKQEAGETPQQCLVRECKEELGITVSVEEELVTTRYTYPERQVLLRFFRARIVQGIPKLHVHAAMQWVHPSEFSLYPMCAGNEEIMKRLQDFTV